jgi:hypothetical protein
MEILFQMNCCMILGQITPNHSEYLEGLPIPKGIEYRWLFAPDAIRRERINNQNNHPQPRQGLNYFLQEPDVLSFQ